MYICNECMYLCIGTCIYAYECIYILHKAAQGFACLVGVCTGIGRSADSALISGYDIIEITTEIMFQCTITEIYFMT